MARSFLNNWQVIRDLVRLANNTHFFFVLVFTLVCYAKNTHFFQIVVPVYELLGSGPDEGIHWYTLCINLKAQRFEALDSIRQKSNPVYVANATTLMNRIKEAWKLYYYKSRVQIEDYKLEIIGVQNIGAQ